MSEAILTTKNHVEALMRKLGCPMIPRTEGIDEILSLPRQKISALTLDDITVYIDMLGQYLIYLNNVQNVYNLLYANLKDDFELKLGAYEMEKKGTQKEKKALVLESDAEMAELWESVKSAEACKTVLSGQTDAVTEYLNAFKKHHAKLQAEASNYYRTQDS